MRVRPYDFGITMRFHEDEYRAAEEILRGEGIGMPEAFRLFVEAVNIEKGLPFILVSEKGRRGKKIQGGKHAR